MFVSVCVCGVWRERITKSYRIDVCAWRRVATKAELSVDLATVVRRHGRPQAAWLRGVRRLEARLRLRADVTMWRVRTRVYVCEVNVRVHVEECCVCECECESVACECV